MISDVVKLSADRKLLMLGREHITNNKGKRRTGKGNEQNIEDIRKTKLARDILKELELNQGIMIERHILAHIFRVVFWIIV